MYNEMAIVCFKVYRHWHKISLKNHEKTWPDSVHTRLELHWCRYLLGSTKRNCYLGSNFQKSLMCESVRVLLMP